MSIIMRVRVEEREDGKFTMGIYEGVHTPYTYVFERHELEIAFLVLAEDGLTFDFLDKVKAQARMA